MPTLKLKGLFKYKRQTIWDCEDFQIWKVCLILDYVVAWEVIVDTLLNQEYQVKEYCPATYWMNMNSNLLLMSIIIASTCYSKPLLLNNESASQQPRTYAFIASRNNRGPIQSSTRDYHHSTSRFITSNRSAANTERQSSNATILHAQQLLGRRSPPLTSARNATSSFKSRNTACFIWTVFSWPLIWLYVKVRKWMQKKLKLK